MDFVERARPFALELVGGRGHYERVVRAAMEARRSVWIATANLKELMVEDHRAVPGRRRTLRTGARPGGRGSYRSILEVFDELVVSGAPDEIGRLVSKRYAGAVDRVGLSMPYDASTETLGRVVAGFRSLTR